MGVNRKAVFFSLTAILIVGVLFLTLSQTVQAPDTGTRIVQLRDVTRDSISLQTSILPALVRSQAYESIRVLATQVQQGSLVYSSQTQFEQDFKQCFLSAQCGGVNSARDVTSQLHNVESSYEKFMNYANVTISISDVTIRELGPFTLGVTATVNYYMYAPVERITINKEEEVTVRIPISGLPDPLASAAFGTPRVVRRAPVGLLVPPASPGSTYTLKTHPGTNTTLEYAINGYYMVDERGPSYLQRLTTNPQKSTEFGIHSISFTPLGVNSVDYMAEEDSFCFYEVAPYGTSQTVSLPANMASLYRIVTDATLSGIVYYNPNCIDAEGSLENVGTTPG